MRPAPGKQDLRLLQPTLSLDDLKDVFRGAILVGAAGLILVHNHPSGQTEPSEEDIQITERLQEVGELVGIEVLDHVIITRLSDEYSSFEELGML